MSLINTKTLSIYVKVPRNRASPARLVKLDACMTEPQRKMIRDINFGGLLNIPCPTIPAEFANWLFVECFDPEASELVFPGRGRIPVTPDSVARIFNLPNKGGKVMYELDVDAINSIQSKYDTIQGSAPKIDQKMEMLKNSKTAECRRRLPERLADDSYFNILVPTDQLGNKPSMLPCLSRPFSCEEVELV